MQPGIPFMQSGLTLLSELSDGDVDWIFSAGRREKVSADATVVIEGTQVASIYLVLQGLLTVCLVSLGGKKLASLGAGQIFGEMSFLEDRPASATVKALEDSELLVIARTDLDAKLQTDPAFAARLYKALAVVTSRRLRELVGTLGRWLEDQPPAEPKTLGRWQKIADQTQQCKALLIQADKAADDGESVAVDELATGIRTFAEFVEHAIGDTSEETLDAREELGARMQREILPYLLKSRTIERFYSKPRGFAGDFQTIALVYANKPAGTDPVGPVFDRTFLALPAVDALRSRRDMLTQIICASAAEHLGPLQITGLCSGPGDELFAAIASGLGPDELIATLVDFDARALAELAVRSKQLGLGARVRLLNTNLFDLATGRPTLDVANQRLVYSINLFDSFDDRLAIQLLNTMHRLLEPGGKAIVASFQRGHPGKAFMDHIVDWKVMHRSVDEVSNLFARSNFQLPGSAPRFEKHGIIFLMECQKT